MTKAKDLDARIEEAAEEIYVRRQAKKRSDRIEVERRIKAAKEMRAIRKARRNKT